jgi:hypothetical protein
MVAYVPVPYRIVTILERNWYYASAIFILHFDLINNKKIYKLLTVLLVYRCSIGTRSLPQATRERNQTKVPENLIY